jgi:predicted DNA-binding transcriptional regulator YafY
MAKKTTPTEKAARMLDLVPFISSHQGIPTPELAAEFGISVEELLSDLNSLWMCGDNRFDLIDIQFDSGYVTIRNAETLNLIRSLSQQEIVAVLLGLDLIEKDLPEDREDLHGDIKGLRIKLGLEIARTVDATPAQDSQINSTISQALGRQGRLSITYYSPTDDEVSVREISPLHMSRSDNRDFLIAFCESAGAQRTFRIDRIQSATLLESKVVQMSETQSDNVRSSVSVKISRNLRKSRESLGTFISGEGSTVEVSTYSAAWLSRTVMSAAGAIEVTSSPEIRGEIASMARKALDLYR